MSQAAFEFFHHRIFLTDPKAMANNRPEPIISVSGLRGIIGESLTPDLAARYVAAFSDELAEGPVVLTRDGRESGPMLVHAIKAALIACGRQVLDADVAATPTTGVLVKSLGASGGIQISASHNPPEYNGIKLFGSDGRVINAERGARVKKAYLEGRSDWVPVAELGKEASIEDPHLAHLETVLATVDVDAIRRRSFKVLLDSNHGAGSLLGQRLLEALGCQVVVLGAVPDGQFAHTPEPTAANLLGVAEEVLQRQVHVGFCQDPDADRLALIDETGRYVGEEFTLAVTLQHALHNQPGPVVINCATSRMSQDLAQQAGVECHVSAVGEANVTDKMLEVNAVYGGEGNGGPIDPRVGLVRDSFVAMSQVLDAMAAKDQPLSEIVDALPQYAIHKTKTGLESERVSEGLQAVAAHFSDAKANWQDGLRLDFPKAWLLVRASNTEPIVRVIAEAETAQLAENLCEQALGVLEK
jgi:phosphomannomutase